MSAAALTLAEAVGVYRLGLGVTGFFAAVAVGLCIYAALLVRTVIPACQCGVRHLSRAI
jgi:hypothetical protein